MRERLNTQKPPGNGGLVCGVARGPARRLDSESIFEFLHAGFQILDFAPLLFYEDVLNSVQARPYLAKLLVHFPRNSFMSSLLAMASWISAAKPSMVVIFFTICIHQAYPSCGGCQWRAPPQEWLI
jgi:hypothetical protein